MGEGQEGSGGKPGRAPSMQGVQDPKRKSQIDRFALDPVPIIPEVGRGAS